MHVALRALVQHHEVSCRDVVADEDMPLRRNERVILPPYIDAQQKQQDCMPSACQTSSRDSSQLPSLHCSTVIFNPWCRLVN